MMARRERNTRGDMISCCLLIVIITPGPVGYFPVPYTSDLQSCNSKFHMLATAIDDKNSKLNVNGPYP